MRTGFTFELTGGALCLDFVNTLEHRNEPRGEEEHLTTYADLLAWCRQAAALSRAELARLARRARRTPQRARAALHRAIRLREALYGVFSAVAAGRTAPTRDVELLNAFAMAGLAKQRLMRGRAGFRWEPQEDGNDLRGPLWPVVRSAVDLLTSDRCAAIRECAAGNCAWLFLDHSRNQSRRWCDMTVCGNRAKARSFYRRKLEPRKRRR
ncbi:MAG: CGNR zinc finger domain-containing protein [Terriglobales bacterium]